MKFWKSIFTFLAITLFFACGSEEADPQATQILGRWEIEEASRNGRITESLAELYYEFDADGKITTNLTGATETGTYTLEEGKLLQRNTKIDADYTLDSLSDSSLIMSTRLRNSTFKFRLIRPITEE